MIGTSCGVVVSIMTFYPKVMGFQPDRLFEGSKKSLVMDKNSMAIPLYNVRHSQKIPILNYTWEKFRIHEVE